MLNKLPVSMQYLWSKISLCSTEKKNYFDFNQLETLFSHSEKLILKSSLTLKRHFNSGLWPLPRTVGLVCVLCSGGGGSRHNNHPNIYNYPAISYSIS